jgi:hypothetical protein
VNREKRKKYMGKEVEEKRVKNKLAIKLTCIQERKMGRKNTEQEPCSCVLKMETAGFSRTA